MARKSQTRPAVDRFAAFVDGRQSLCVALIALVALGLRLWHLMESRANDPFFELLAVDPKVYHEWAVAIAEGNLVGDDVFFLSPLYPYFLGLIYSITGPGFLVARLLQSLLGAGGCVLVYFLGKKVFEPRVGFVAGLLCAVYQPLIFYDNTLLVTALQTPLNLILALALVRASERTSWRWWGLAGAILGLSALARPNVLLLGGFVLAYIFVVAKERGPIKASVVRAAAFCLGIGLVVFPCTARNYLVGDDLVLVSSQGGANFYIGNGPGANGSFRVPDIFPTTRADDPLQQEEAYRVYAEKKAGRELKPSEVSSFWYGETWEHIGERPGEWVTNLLFKLGLMFNHHEIGNSRDLEASREFSRVLRVPLPGFGLLGVLGLLGLVLAARRSRQAYFVYSMVGVYLVSLVIFFVLAHYRLPVVPFLAVFAGLAVVWAYDALRGRRLVPLALALAGLVAAAALVNYEHEELTESRFMIHYNLGNKYRLMGKWELAAREYQLSIDEKPDYISAYNNLALAYENDPATYTKAIEVWQKVLEMARQRRDGLYVERSSRHLNRLRQLTGNAGPRDRSRR